MNIFDQYESEVRFYCRGFPDVFVAAKGARLRGRSGRDYIDFFAGAGTLNYGHNDEAMKARLIAYLSDDGIVHGLDMATGAKEAFIRGFQDTILAPRGLSYRMLFPGPTGTNAVEVALKLARKATGRQRIVSFVNGFHGMTLGALAVSGGPLRQPAAGPQVGGTVFLPYDGGSGCDSLEWFERMLAETSDPAQSPAGCIVETVQAEGGIVAASMDWLRRLEQICRRHGILLILDDIQAGCGRTGTFFSFEPAGLVPDIICLAKSLSGIGLPLALVLVKAEHDRLAPGEHNGTFRGNNLAFVTATEALRFWRDDALERAVVRKAATIRRALEAIAAAHPDTICPAVRGRGMIQGLATPSGAFARRVSAEAFARGLVMETAGPHGEVLKCLCPLVITDEDLDQGLRILAASVAAAEAA